MGKVGRCTWYNKCAQHSKETQTHTDTKTQTQPHSVPGTSVQSRDMAEVELYSDSQYVKSDQEKRTVAAL